MVSPLQANTTPPKLSQKEADGRGALLTDICRGPRLKKVEVVSDSKSPTAESQTPPTDHPYIRLYQYLHQQQGAPSEEQQRTALESKNTFCDLTGRLQEAAGGRPAAKCP